MFNKDFYEEKGVVAKPNVKGNITMWIMGAIAVLSVVASYWFVPSLMIFLATGTIFVMMFRERYVEYDYQINNEEIEISKIVNRKRRRTAILFNVNNIRFIAPPDSLRVSNEQERNPNMRFTDYTSLEPTSEVYALVLDLRGINTVILMELTDTMYEHLKNLIPNKIYED